MVVAITNFCKKFEIAGILGASHILSISIFENTEKTIESNRSKKETTLYFAVAN